MKACLIIRVAMRLRCDYWFKGTFHVGLQITNVSKPNKTKLANESHTFPCCVLIDLIY